MRKRTRLQYVKGFKYSHQNNLRKKEPKRAIFNPIRFKPEQKNVCENEKSKNMGKGAKFDPLLMDHINVK